MTTDPKPRRKSPDDRPRNPGEVSISGERRPSDGKASVDETAPPDESGDAAPLETFEQPTRAESPDDPGGVRDTGGKAAVDAV